MMRVALTKMSSLGDIVHTFPALSDAAAHDIRVDWIVDEQFADLVALHPAVENVIPIALRGRGSAKYRSVSNGVRGSLKLLRGRSYDLILDAQGLIKSAFLSSLARSSNICGYTADSARESLAAVFYNKRMKVAKNQHAIERIRSLFGYFLNYDIPDTLNYGIENKASREKLCVLIHGTTWNSKIWPEDMWLRLGQLAAASGMQVAIPWSGETERNRATRLASAFEATLWGELPLRQLAKKLTKSCLVIGVDSGLTHLSAALGNATVAIYGSTSHKLTGVRGRRALSLSAEFPCSPCLRKKCNYSGLERKWNGLAVSPSCYTTVTPDIVWKAAENLINENRV